jgi:hypothetical protein
MAKEVVMTEQVFWQLNRERHNDLLTEAANHRLAKVAPAHNGRVGRVSVNLGNLLIALGQRLKARYEPVARLQELDACEGLRGRASDYPC